jgi:hypothetical protein
MRLGEVHPRGCTVGELFDEPCAGCLLHPDGNPSPVTDAGAVEITEESLAEALDHFYLWIMPDYTQAADHGIIFGFVRDPDSTAEVLYATLSRMAALKGGH